MNVFNFSSNDIKIQFSHVPANYLFPSNLKENLKQHKKRLIENQCSGLAFLWEFQNQLIISFRDRYAQMCSFYFNFFMKSCENNLLMDFEKENIN